ncbi:MAG: chitobiase/beta-hexosaminidase C-terminal domain-containing protein [Muribaculaceae bacterium]|nr:chitobiase/beta-hexosaminidase C-terminal domain-containing protein [Muribaculaceae bacterium]
MKKLITLFLIATFAASVGRASITVSNSIANIADANNWENSIKYTSFKLDDNITVSCTGGGNTGKYYTNGEEWRLYQNENPKLIVTAASGYILNTITVTYNVENTGILVYNSTNISSPATVTVSGSRAEFSVGNSASATNGQVRVTAISVTYSLTSSITVQEPTITDEFTFWPVMNDEASAEITIIPASGNKVRYTTNGSNPSFTNGTEIAAATTINISGTTTVNAISYVENQTSSVVSKTYTLGQTVTGIDGFKNLADGTTARLYLPDNYSARTLFVKGNDAFVRDKTGSICIYNVTTNPPLEYNQHIAGWIIGTYTNYNGLPEFTASSVTNSCYLVVADPVTEADVEPVEIEADDFADHYADWVTICDLKVTQASGNTATANADGSTFSIYNKYNPEGYQLPYEGAIVDITGIATLYNDKQELRPINQNDNRPVTYVIDSQEDFTSPSVSIADAQVRFKRYLSSQDWNLLTLPFEVEGFEGEVLEYTGVTLGEVGAYEMNGRTYPIYSGVMHFEDYYGNLQPGTPYLVRPSISQQEMTLSGVTISKAPASSVTFSLAEQRNAPGINLMANETPAYVGDYSLVGTYSPTTLPKNESTVIMIDSNNLSWTSLVNNTEIAGTDAYITVPDGAGVKLDLAGSGVVTAVADIRLDNSIPQETIIYNILGQRLTRPLSELPPGVYIVNGKKIVKR